MNKQAVRAQIESDEVDADSVRSTGDSDNSARKTNIDDFNAFDPTRSTKIFQFIRALNIP